MSLVYKILLAIIAFVIIAKFITPLLLPLFPPFGLIAVIILYLVVLGWLLGVLPSL